MTVSPSRSVQMDIELKPRSWCGACLEGCPECAPERFPAETTFAAGPPYDYRDGCERYAPPNPEWDGKESGSGVFAVIGGAFFLAAAVMAATIVVAWVVKGVARV